MSLRFRTVSIFFSGLLLMILGLFVLVPNTQALIIPGGTPSGSTGSYYTTNGFGWYSYDVNSPAGPEAWAVGGPWNAVRAACQAEGASRFDAFIIQRSGGNDSGNNAKVYKWEAGGYSTRWPGYKGDRGGNWLSLPTAQAHFNSIPDKGGYQFGVNVAGFCYQDTKYTLTPSLTSSRVGGEAGEPVDVTPRVVNTGPSSSRTTYWAISSMTYPSAANPPNE